MRRPTPTQSMNTTQRSSFIILKNPMSSTKPNPTVDTEREIHKIHSGTLQGSGDTGHSPGTSRCPRSAGGETGKQNPQDACYGSKKRRPTGNAEGRGAISLARRTSSVCGSAGRPSLSVKGGKNLPLQHPKDSPYSTEELKRSFSRSQQYFPNPPSAFP